jgi:hypothetical protein
MIYSRQTRRDDTLFIALLVIPAVLTTAFYLQSESQIDRLASASKPPVAIAKSVPARTAAANARLASANAND